MIKPIFRNPDKFQRLPFRDWIRENLPTGQEGYVVEDLDLIIRACGQNFNSDGIGKFMLIELKYGSTWIGYAQRKTFGLIHQLLRESDPDRIRYIGYFIIQYDDENWDDATFKVNTVELSRTELLRFLSFDREILAYIPSILKG